MQKHSPSRYRQLTDIQRQTLLGGEPTVALHEGLNSFTGKPENLRFFQKAFKDFKDIVAGWKIEDPITIAFVSWCNDTESRESNANFNSGIYQFKYGIAKFFIETKRTNLALQKITSSDFGEFVAWLKERKTTKGSPYSANTLRKLFGFGKTLFEEMGKIPSISKLLHPDFSFPNNPYSFAHLETKNAEVLDDFIWQQLVECCIKDVMEIMYCVRSGWGILAGKECNPDDRRRGRGRYSERAAVLWELKRTYPKLIPPIKVIAMVNRELADAIHENHRQDSVTRPFYPQAADLVPFILLQAIYTQANTSSLRGIKLDNIKYVEVFGVQRICFLFEKPRAHAEYERTFVIEPEDKVSPNELYLFIKKWTKKIRSDAKDWSDRLYIFVTNERTVRAFNTIENNGRISDSSWKFAVKQFVKRHGLPNITLQMIRTTGLDKIRTIFNDDIRAVQAAGGQKAQATIDMYYEGAGVKQRRNERLAETMATQERWAKSGGKIHARSAPENADLGSATPGWICWDPFDSPIAGESKGKLCQAFGQCPICPLGSIDLTSPYALARLVQLTDEVQLAQTYLDQQRWRVVFAPVLKKNKEHWLPLFVDKNVIAAAAEANLNPIGRLE